MRVAIILNIGKEKCSALVSNSVTMEDFFRSNKFCFCAETVHKQSRSISSCQNTEGNSWYSGTLCDSEKYKTLRPSKIVQSKLMSIVIHVLSEGIDKQHRADR